MRQQFIYDQVKECKTDYLIRMAKVIDSIRNGSVAEDGVNYKEALSEEEKKEVENYVFAVMLPTIREEGSYYVRKNNLQNVSDSYLNHLYEEVWRNFYKFNNPLYKETEGTCAFRTFVKMYVKEPARTTINKENGTSKAAGYYKRLVKNTQNYICREKGKSLSSITAEDIFEEMHNVSTTQLSLELIKKILERMQVKASIEDIENDSNYSSEMDELYIASENVMQAFETFMKKLRPLQQFIFCQNYGFCSNKYDGISIAQLVCDPDFLKIVKDDNIGKKHLTISNVTIDEPRENGFVIQGGPIILNNVEHIDVNFVSHQRVRCKNLIVDFVKDNELDEYDVMSSLTKLLEEAWDELSSKYGLK